MARMRLHRPRRTRVKSAKGIWMRGRPVTGLSPFSPLSLFANGEQGVWFDPSDPATLFRDEVGTIPVTADGDPVGLMLDKSQGLVLGSEVITNGDFSAGSTGWTTGGAATIVGGVADTANGGYWDQSQSPTAGKIYRVAFSVVRYASGSVRPFFIGGTTVGGNAVTATGDYVQYIFAESGNSTLRFSTGSGSDLAIDNISVKELPGNHGSQATTSLKPVFSTDGTVNWAEYASDLIDHGAISGLGPCTYFIAMRTTQASTQTVITSGTASTSTFLIVTASGASRTDVSSGYGTVTIRVDGAEQVSPTRDSLFTAICDGQWHVVEVDATTPQERTFVGGKDEVRFVGDLGEFIIAEGVSESDKAKTRQYIADIYGIVL